MSKLKHNTTLVERNVFGCINKFDCFYVYLYISYELLNLVQPDIITYYKFHNARLRMSLY